MPGVLVNQDEEEELLCQREVEAQWSSIVAPWAAE